MRTLVIGDSIVYHTAKFNDHPQLVGGGVVTWQGIRGAKIHGLTSHVAREIRGVPYPTTIIIALGTNNIFTTPLGRIHDILKERVDSLRELLPNTRLIWSDVLPRKIYKKETSKGAGKRYTIDMNDNAHKIFKNLGNAHIIRNAPTILAHKDTCFYDDVHLNKEGQKLLIQQFERALQFFNAFPNQFEYPCRVV